MTKTLNQIIFFFPPPKSEYFFQGNQNIFLEKKHNPPFKLNGPSLMTLPIKTITSVLKVSKYIITIITAHPIKLDTSDNFCLDS